MTIAACGGRSTSSHGDDPAWGEPASGGVGGSSAGTGGAPGAGGSGSVTTAGTGGTTAGAGGTGATTGVGGTSPSVTAGVGGNTLPVDVTACSPDGIRLGTGGNVSDYPIPPGACQLRGEYFCRGESTTIGGDCPGTCTCVSGDSWSCSYAGCEPGCTADGGTYAVGGGWLEDDLCTSCQCTELGIVCTDTACQRQRRCDAIEAEFALALDDARRCDPAVHAPVCAHRFARDLVCERGDLPVDDSWELAQIQARFVRDGCLPSGKWCPPPSMAPHVPVGDGTPGTICSDQGYCIDVP